MYENLGNIRPRVQAISPKVYIGVFYPSVSDKARIEGVQRRVLDQIDGNIVKMTDFENS